MSGARQPDQEGARKAKKPGRRQVEFAPGPLQDKYSTYDGHPDHEGRVARPKRSLGASWGHDLTPSSIRELEAQLGEDCRPSLDRLKRRVGLLPLRKRPKTFLTWMIDSSSSSSEEEEGPSGGKGKGTKKKEGAASMAATAATAGAKAKQPRKRKQPPQRAAEAELGPASFTGAEGAAGEEKQAEDFLAAAVASVMGGNAGAVEAPSASAPSLAATAAAAGAAAATATAAGVQPALGSRKTRQKAGEAAAGLGRRLVPPSRLRAGLSWLTGKEQAPIPPLTKGTVPGRGAPLAEPLPAVTHTFGRRGGGQAASRASHMQAPAVAAAAPVPAAAAAAPAATGAAPDSEAAPVSSPGSQSLTLPSGAAGSTSAEPKLKRSRRLGSLADSPSKSMGFLGQGKAAAASAPAAAAAAAAAAVPAGGAPSGAGAAPGSEVPGTSSGSGSQSLTLPSVASGSTSAEPKLKRSRRLGNLADPHSRGMAGLLCRGL